MRADATEFNRSSPTMLEVDVTIYGVQRQWMCNLVHYPGRWQVSTPVQWAPGQHACSSCGSRCLISMGLTHHIMLPCTLRSCKALMQHAANHSCQHRRGGTVSLGLSRQLFAQSCHCSKEFTFIWMKVIRIESASSSEGQDREPHHPHHSFHLSSNIPLQVHWLF